MSQILENVEQDPSSTVLGKLQDSFQKGVIFNLPESMCERRSQDSNRRTLIFLPVASSVRCASELNSFLMSATQSSHICFCLQLLIATNLIYFSQNIIVLTDIIFFQFYLFMLVYQKEQGELGIFSSHCFSSDQTDFDYLQEPDFSRSHYFYCFLIFF